ncbi:MAG: lipase maturation factor family protein, partial [Verrucomicrobiae bacterium]|nr:lipase maturation factor family protein [Verrucomicrobiae bacterium]
DSLHLVNTYGAFGSVGKERFEIVVQGTDSANPYSEEAEWREYGFYGKPGDPFRRPPFYSPYHRRLDWEIWFAALGSLKGEYWPVYLSYRLLHNEPRVVSLFRKNPFPDAPPRYIRLRRIRYRFTTPEEHAETGAWWVRRDERNYFGPVSLENQELKNILNQAQWPDGR